MQCRRCDAMDYTPTYYCRCHSRGYTLTLRKRQTIRTAWELSLLLIVWSCLALLFMVADVWFRVAVSTKSDGSLKGSYLQESNRRTVQTQSVYIDTVSTAASVNVRMSGETNNQHSLDVNEILNTIKMNILTWKTDATLDDNNVQASLIGWNKMPSFTVIPEHSLMDLQTINFLSMYKNPCWYGENGLLECMPYFFQIGFPKCGTTDFFQRLILHPHIVRPLVKEPHWFAKARFYRGLWGKRKPRFTEYVKYWYSNTTSVINTVTNLDQKGHLTHPLITGDFSCSNSFDNRYWRSLPENRDRKEPLFTNADYIRHLNPNAKIIALVRDPIDRLYSEYLHFSPGPFSADHFHQIVVKAVGDSYQCMRQHSIRACANDDRLIPDVPIRLWVGAYYIHLIEFFKVFPTNQILVIKTEDYSANTTRTLKDVISFLKLEDTPSKILVEMSELDRANTRRKSTETVGEMFQKTRLMLFEFYKPFNKLLAQMLGNDDFEFDQIK